MSPDGRLTLIVVISMVVILVGFGAIALAPEIMNEAEVGTLRVIAGVAIAAAVIAVGVGVAKRQRQ